MARKPVPEVNDLDGFDDLEGFERAELPSAVVPHIWAQPASNFDLSLVKPHACMVDVVQRGSYVHCNLGNHGMRVPRGKMLAKIGANGKMVKHRDDPGEWQFVPLVLIKEK